jgi:hypothetical protein
MYVSTAALGIDMDDNPSSASKSAVLVTPLKVFLRNLLVLMTCRDHTSDCSLSLSLCKAVYVDKYQPMYDTERNGPADAFAVWCPLSYTLLGAECVQDKEAWIAAIEDRREVCIPVAYLLAAILCIIIVA